VLVSLKPESLLPSFLPFRVIAVDHRTAPVHPVHFLLYLEGVALLVGAVFIAPFPLFVYKDVAFPVPNPHVEVESQEKQLIIVGSEADLSVKELVEATSCVDRLEKVLGKDVKA